MSEQIQELKLLTEGIARSTLDLKNEATNFQRSQGERMETVERIIGEIKAQYAAAPSVVNFPKFDPTMLKYDNSQEGFNRMLRSETVGPEVVREIVSEVKRASDEYFMVLSIMNLDPKRRGNPIPQAEIESWKSKRRFDSAIRALNTQVALEGGNWVPESMSTDIMAYFQLQLSLASQFREVQCSTQLWRYPFRTAKPKAQVFGERSGSTMYTDNPYTLTVAGAAFGTNKPADKKTFDNDKRLRAFEIASDMFDEDSIVAAIPMLIEDMGFAIKDGWSQAILNGDTHATTHIDDDVTEAPTGTSPQVLVDGLRDHYLNMTTPPVVNVTATPSIADYRNLRAKMMPYGADLANLFFLVGGLGSVHIASIPQVITLDKLGPNATVLKGQLFALDMIPIVLDPSVREDISANGKNTTAGPNDKTATYLIHRTKWIKTRRLGMTVETDRFITTGETIVVAMDRGDFGYVGATGASADKVVGAIHGIPATVTVPAA
jgi:hypothetical protein